MPFDSLPVLDEVALTLHNARGYIERGWCKGQMFVDDKHCALGAINMATRDLKKRAIYNKALERLIRAMPPHSVGKTNLYFLNQYPSAGLSRQTIIQWNDRSRRTKKDVLAAFDRAIRADN